MKKKILKLDREIELVEKIIKEEDFLEIRFKIAMIINNSSVRLFWNISIENNRES